MLCGLVDVRRATMAGTSGPQYAMPIGMVAA
jgi:hypothetical protein